MHLFLLFLLASVEGATVGIIKPAQIWSLAPSIWLYDQSSWSQCMCYALQDQSVVAFNSYASNSSCQFFQNLSSFPFQITNVTNITVYLLKPLQVYTPCCSNLTWLMSRIKSVQNTMSISSIRSITFDTDRNRLGTVGSNVLRLVSTDSFTLVSLNQSLPINTQAITYHADLFYVGIFPATGRTFYIYSALNLTLVKRMNFTQGSPQRIIWLYNETLVFILLQRSATVYSLVNLYNWPSLTLNNSIQINITNAYGLGKAPDDDRFIYISDASPYGGVWRIRTSSPYNITQFTLSSSNSESAANVVVDSCNRLWVAFYGFGIRIYNISSGATLYSWNLIATYPQLYDLILTDQYQLYLADASTSKLVRYGLPIQCTN